LKKERLVSRIKIIHASSGSELKKVFDEGSVIISPGQALIAEVEKRNEQGKPFFMVPAFFFIEFCKWADIKDNSSPSIIARSTDKGSDLALKARNSDRRFEEYGNEGAFTARYVEHLNFISFLYGDHPLAENGEPFVLGFCRGEFMTGKNFITSISRIKAPLWSQVWKFNTQHRDRNNFQWWGLDFSRPDEEIDGVPGFIKENEIEFFRTAHEELKQQFENRLLVVDRSEQEDETVSHSETEF
jgi:hypothetical protein